MIELLDASKAANVDVLTRCADMLTFVTEVMANGNPNMDLKLSQEAQAGLCMILMAVEVGTRGVIRAIGA